MPEHLLDFKIIKVYEAQDKEGNPIEGTGEYGNWKLYNFYTDKTGKEKFSYMHGGNKPLPQKDMAIKHMEYEEVHQGQYTNLKVKKLELAESKSESKSESKPLPTQERDISFYVSYAKDLAVAILEGNGKLDELQEIAVDVARAGKVMMLEINSSQGPKLTPKTDDKKKQDKEDGEKQLRAKFKRFAKADNEKYFKILGTHGIEEAEEAIQNFSQEARDNLLKDLEKGIEIKNY